MAENKHQPGSQDPFEVIRAVGNPLREADGLALLAMYEELTGEKPVVWYPGIIGFGICHLAYETGRKVDTPAAAFAVRKANLVLYGLKDSPEGTAALSGLGNFKEGKGCVYVTRLKNVDETVLRELILTGYRYSLDALNQP